MANLAIKGHATRGEEVIEILEMLGGKNVYQYEGYNVCSCLFIDEVTNAIHSELLATIYYKRNVKRHILTIEEFLEKFPYKVGDRVRIPEYESEVRISSMYWDGCEVQYEVFTDEYDWYSANELNEYNTDTLIDKEGEKKSLLSQLIEYFRTTPKDKLEREWNEHNELDKIGPTVEEYVAFVESIKKQPKYPTTYEECCKVLGYKQLIIPKSMMAYNITLLGAFQKLLVCRDAYYVIAKEQMRLGKPWKRDYDDMCFIIRNDSGIIHTYEYHGSNNVILAFPTAEMRDAFYENFKELIEACKGLL